MRPFIAPVLLEATGTLRGAALLRRVVNKANERAKASTETTKRRLVRTTEIDESDGLLFQAILYHETAEPSWSKETTLQDERNELIVVAVHDHAIALCASDAVMRDRIVKEVSAVRRMPREAIAAFVTGEARALWLNGIHTPTASKPDTKAVTGLALEYALDPIGDQTYYWSAGRMKSSVSGLATPDGDAKPKAKSKSRVKAKSEPLVGAAPGQARLWIRRAQDWPDFKRVIGVIINHALHGPRRPDPLSSLAQPVYDMTGVTGAYGLAVIPSQLLSEDEISDADRLEANRWAFEATYEVRRLAGLSLEVKPIIDGSPIGKAELTITVEDGTASIALKWTEAPEGRADDRKACGRFLAHSDQVKIFYESGHSIAQGRCYAGGYSDQKFEWSFRSFTNYAIDREKPVVPNGSTLSKCIAVGGDNSLFAYVVEKMFCDDAGKPKGWLASDDGSMELADFIHVDPEAKVISLVHVKASGKTSVDRLAAPSDYEIVVSQAVKNLRHLDRRNLHDELTKGKGKKIGKAVWFDGKPQKDRSTMLKAIAKLPANAAKVLVVLQPRVTQKERDRCWATDAPDKDAMRMKQIDTLMLGARVSALSCGATFIGIGDSGT